MRLVKEVYVRVAGMPATAPRVEHEIAGNRAVASYAELLGREEDHDISAGPR